MSTRNNCTIFEPSDLQSLGLAFDDAWEAIAHRFGNAGSDVVAQARGRLATIMMELAKQERLEPEDIKRAALDRFRETLECACQAHEASSSQRAEPEGPHPGECH